MSKLKVALLVDEYFGGTGTVYGQGLIILDHFSHVIFKNKEIKKDLIDLASVIK